MNATIEGFVTVPIVGAELGNIRGVVGTEIGAFYDTNVAHVPIVGEKKKKARIATNVSLNLEAGKLCRNGIIYET